MVILQQKLLEVQQIENSEIGERSCLHCGQTILGTVYVDHFRKNYCSILTNLPNHC